jgi:hypothetical protein
MDRFEEITGYDYFLEMEDEIEDKLESADTYFDVNLKTVRYIKVNRTNMRTDFIFDDDQRLPVGIESTGSTLVLSKDKFSQLLNKITVFCLVEKGGRMYTELEIYRKERFDKWWEKKSLNQR